MLRLKILAKLNIPAIRPEQHEVAIFKFDNTILLRG